MGVPATGRSCSIGEIHIFRIKHGKIAEHWHQFDGLGMMRQLTTPSPNAWGSIQG